jgi:putative transposase
MDFLVDMLAGGRRLRLLPVIDVYSRECLAIEVDTSLTGQRVSRVLDQIREVRGGLPERIMVDNGPEFAGRELDRWAYENGVKLHFIEPGKPMQNGYIESFNGKFRNECLNEHWFPSVNNARQMTEDWRQLYNQVRPHSSLGKQTPAEFAALHSRLRSATPPSAGNVPDETVLQTMGGLS